MSKFLVDKLGKKDKSRRLVIIQYTRMPDGLIKSELRYVSYQQCIDDNELPVSLSNGSSDVSIPYSFGKMSEQKVNDLNPNAATDGYIFDISTSDDDLRDITIYLKQKFNL